MLKDKRKIKIGNVIMVFILILCAKNGNSFAQIGSETMLRLQIEDGDMKSVINRSRAIELFGTDNFLSNGAYDVTMFFDTTFTYRVFFSDPNWNRVIWAQLTLPFNAAVGSFGSYGLGTGQLDNPHGIAVRYMSETEETNSKVHLAIADTDNGRVVYLQLSSDLGTIDEENYLGDSILKRPMDVAIDDRGRTHDVVQPLVWVTDPGGNQIVALDFSGNVVHQYTSLSGITDGDDLSGLEGISVRQEPVLIELLDDCFCSWDQYSYTGSERIYVTDVNKKAVYLLEVVEGSIAPVLASHLFSDEDSYPISVSWDLNGDIWVPDQNSSKLYKFTFDLEPLATFGNHGAGDHEFKYPTSATQIRGSSFFLTSEHWGESTGFKSMRHGADIFDVKAAINSGVITLNYHLTNRNYVTIKLLDQDDNIVQTVINHELRDSGSNILTFDMPTAVYTSLKAEFTTESIANDEPYVSLSNPPIVVTKVIDLSLLSSTTGYWSFNGYANDQSGNGNDGTLKNGAVYTEGLISQAIDFDGDNDYVEISDYSAFNNLSSFSLSAWIYPTQIKSHNPIISKVNPNKDFVLNITNSGKLQSYFAQDEIYYTCTSDEIIPLDIWSHVAAVWTENEWQLYYNGNLIKTTDYPGHVPLWTGTRMGIGTMNWSEFFSGKIDEVKVYNIALSSEQIQKEYNKGLGIKTNVSYINDEQLKIPEVFDLSQNFPNPFNPTTTIRYQIPGAENVKIMIYNILGQEVRELVHTKQNAGYYTVKWDGKNQFGSLVVSGIYIYQMQAGKFIQTRKMLLLK